MRTTNVSAGSRTRSGDRAEAAARCGVDLRGGGTAHARTSASVPGGEGSDLDAQGLGLRQHGGDDAVGVLVDPRRRAHDDQRAEQLPGRIDDRRCEPGDPLVDLLTLAGPAVSPHLGHLGEQRIDIDDRLRGDLLERLLREQLAQPLVVELREVELAAAGRVKRPALPQRHGVLERAGAVDEVDRDAVRALEHDQLGRLAERRREPLEVPARAPAQDLDGGRCGEATDESEADGVALRLGVDCEVPLAAHRVKDPVRRALRDPEGLADVLQRVRLAAVQEQVEHVEDPPDRPVLRSGRSRR